MSISDQGHASSYTLRGQGMVWTTCSLLQIQEKQARRIYNEGSRARLFIHIVSHWLVFTTFKTGKSEGLDVHGDGRRLLQEVREALKLLVVTAATAPDINALVFSRFELGLDEVVLGGSAQGRVFVAGAVTSTGWRETARAVNSRAARKRVWLVVHGVEFVLLHTLRACCMLRCETR